MRIGILELLIADGDRSPLTRLYGRFISRHYASIMPQAVSYWCRSLGHEAFYATYWGQADPLSLLPDDLQVVFISSYTSASSLANALAKLYRRRGVLTVSGGPHARSFPQDSARFFDIVIRECDRTLIDELLRDLPRRQILSSGRLLRALPTVAERLPEIETAHFLNGRAGGTSFVPLLASLGCPYSCDFCTDWDNPYRLTPLDQLEEDLRFISTHFPRAKIPFHDPNFAVKFDQVLDVLERLPAKDRNAYIIQSSLSVLREDRLRRLRDTNCVYIAPGVESWTEYSNKAGVSRSHSGREKLDEVIGQFERIGRYVRGIQANFLFGVDCDRGDEPVELSKVFMDRLPGVWPNFNVPTPFGGTPLYDEYMGAGRILARMPFCFYYTPYLVTTLAHYAPEQFYDHLIALFSHLVSARSLGARTRASSGIHHVFNALRALNVWRTLHEFHAIRDRLRGDREFRDFHDGVSDRLPEFYRSRSRGLLGRYAELLSPDDLTPQLEPLHLAGRIVRSAVVH